MTSRAQTTVLHVRIVSGTGGGPEKTIVNSPRHMQGSGFRALAAYLHAPSDPGIAEVARRAEIAGCELIAIPDAFEGGQVVQQARAVNSALPIIARAHFEEEIVHLKRHGANIVVMGEHEIAKSMLVNIGEAAPKRAKPRRRTRSD